jgi:hypothetical protein
MDNYQQKLFSGINNQIFNNKDGSSDIRLESLSMFVKPPNSVPVSNNNTAIKQDEVTSPATVEFNMDRQEY